MTPRLATAEDVPDIAALHVQAWIETYTGLLPPEEFARRDLNQRLTIWGRIIASGMPVSYLSGVGFAHMGDHRNEKTRATYPRELYSFYTLQHAHGSGAGQALLDHALGDTFQPFTAEVLQGNARATAFYQKIGGQQVTQTHETLHGWEITNIIFGWSVPIQLKR